MKTVGASYVIGILSDVMACPEKHPEYPMRSRVMGIKKINYYSCNFGVSGA